jgi:hypothetical protein
MTPAQAREIGEKLIRKADEAQARSVTTRINPPLSPAEREQRYQQVLRELRDAKFYQIGITGMLLKRGYLWPKSACVKTPTFVSGTTPRRSPFTRCITISCGCTKASRMLIEFFMAERSLFGRHG